jgi:hypothetical protein
MPNTYSYRKCFPSSLERSRIAAKSSFNWFDPDQTPIFETKQSTLLANQIDTLKKDAAETANNAENVKHLQ